MIEYKYFNLLENMSSLCTYDVVFCRNVLIYFDEATKKKVLEEMARLMPDDGLLFLGGAETVLGITDVFKPVPDHRGLYTKENSVHFGKIRSILHYSSVPLYCANQLPRSCISARILLEP